jgi:hypothetical protein
MYACKSLDVRPNPGEPLDAAIERVTNDFLSQKQMAGDFRVVSTHFTISDAFKKIIVVIFFDFTENSSSFSAADMT